MKDFFVLKEKKDIIFAGTIILTFVFLIVFSVYIIRSDEVGYAYNAGDFWYNEENHMYNTPAFLLKPAIYKVSIRYNASAEADMSYFVNPKGHDAILCMPPRLSPCDTEAEFDVWVNETLDQVSFGIRIDDGDLNIQSFTIESAYNSKLFRIVCAVFAVGLILSVVYIILNRGIFAKYSYEILGIAVITIVSSAAIFTRYLILGHDLDFHLLRIEGIKDSILAADFPAKIQTRWNSGWGYAVSAMYGDTTLVIPALMRLLGFTMQTSYKTFVFLVNMGTALSAYFCFGKFCRGDKTIALLSSFLYTCSPYRFCCIYLRAAVGEYTGMLFLPMIVLGLYYAYMENEDGVDYGKKYIVPALGVTGLIQSHILTCIMVSIFAFLFVVICYKRTFTKNTFVYLLKLTGWVVVLNLWFIVPLLRFMSEPLVVKNQVSFYPDYQWYGLSLAEIIAQHASESISYNWGYLTSLSSRMSMPLGNGFVIAFLVYVYMAWNRKLGKKTKALTLVVGLALFALWMASNKFPYDIIHTYLPILSDYITRVNIPFRYLTISILLFSIFVVLFYKKIISKLKRKTINLLIMLIFLVSLDQSMYYMYSVIYSGGVANYYDAAYLDDDNLIGGEYLYEGSSTDVSRADHDVIAENAEFSIVSHKGNKYTIDVNATGDWANVQLPLYYYPGYIAIAENKKSIDIDKGNNNRIMLRLENGYSGRISVQYKEPLLWRICEVISFVGLILLILYEKGIHLIKSKNRITKK